MRALRAAAIWALILAACTGGHVHANGAGGYQQFSSMADWQATSTRVTTYAGSKLNLSNQTRVYVDNFTTGSGGTGVACDLGLETNAAGSGSHNWFAQVVAGNPAFVDPASNTALYACPISGLTQGITLNVQWNAAHAQYEGLELYQASRAGYGPSYSNATWKVRARFNVPVANFYPWVAVWFNTIPAQIGVPSKYNAYHNEFDGLETYPSSGLVLTGTISAAGSGGTNGVYTNVPFTCSCAGTGFLGNVTVSGGAMTAVAVATAGRLYGAGNVLSPTGITGLTGATETVSTVNAGNPNVPDGIVDMNFLQWPSTVTSLTAGHIVAGGSGGSDGTYTKNFTGGSGFSGNATFVVSGGTVTSVTLNYPFTGSNWVVGNTLGVSGITGLTGFSYSVDAVGYIGPPAMPAVTKRGAAVYYTPPLNVFDGQFHNWETKFTPNWIIEYVDETEIARYPVTGDDERQPWQLIIGSSGALSGSFAALGTGGNYAVDIAEVDIYQCTSGLPNC